MAATVVFSPVGNGFQWFGQTGLVLAGGKINTYLAGSTTRAATYTDNTGTVANANPIILDSTGRYSQEIWLDATLVPYKFVVTDSLGVTQFTIDNIPGSGNLSSNINYTAPVTGSVTTTISNKFSKDLPSITDVGGSSSATDNGAAINNAISDYPLFLVPQGTFNNTSTAVTVPLNKGIVRGSSLFNNSGSGSIAFNGVDISYLDNPSARTDWSNISGGGNYAGLSSDIGGFGKKEFIGLGLVAGLQGAVSIPASASIPAHSMGVAGYAKTLSTTTGAVAVFGYCQGAVTANSIFGANFLVSDNNFQSTAYGLEVDCNINNVNTGINGVWVVGGSTVEPSGAYAVHVGALGVGFSPVKRWNIGFLTDDGACVTGLTLGMAGVTANSSAQPFTMYYANGSAARTLGMTLSCDGGGSVTLLGNTNGSIVAISSSVSGVPQYNFRAFNAQCGFFGSLGGNQVTGYGTPTGGSHQASFAAGTITLANLAAAVAQLIVDLKSYNLIGA